MDNENLRKIFSSNLNYWLDKRGKTQADLYKKNWHYLSYSFRLVQCKKDSAH